MSDTPRTDEAEMLMGGLWYVLSDVARELERELAQAVSGLSDVTRKQNPTPREDVAKNVVVLRPAAASAGDAPAGTSAGFLSDEAGPSSSQHPADLTRLAEGFGDPETLFNSRDWLRAALEARGAKITGGGVGMGQCDLDFELEGCKFNVALRPEALK